MHLFRILLAAWMVIPAGTGWATPEDRCGYTRFGELPEGYIKVEETGNLKESLGEMADNYADGYKQTKAVLVPGKTWEPTSRLGGGWNDWWAGRYRRWRHLWRPSAETYPRYHRDKGVEEMVEGLIAQIRNPKVLEKTVKGKDGKEQPWPNRAPEVIRDLEKWLNMPTDIENVAKQGFAHEYNLRHIRAAENQSSKDKLELGQGLEIPWAIVKDGTITFTRTYGTVNELPVMRKLEEEGIRRTFGGRPSRAALSTLADGAADVNLGRGLWKREEEQAELHRRLNFVRMQLNHLAHAEPNVLERPIPGAEGTRFEGRTYGDLHDDIKAIDRKYDHLRSKERRDHLVRQETANSRKQLYWREFWTEFRSIFNIRRAQEEASEFTQARLDEFTNNPGATVSHFANSVRDPSFLKKLLKGRSWLRGLVLFAGGITLGATALGTFYTLTIKPGVEAWQTVRKWTDPVAYCAARFKGWQYEDCIKEWVQVAYFVEFQHSRYDPEHRPFEGRPEALAEFEARMKDFAQRKVQYHRFYEKALEIAKEEEQRILAMEKEEQEKLMRDLAGKMAEPGGGAAAPPEPKRSTASEVPKAEDLPPPPAN